jgi:hypothetical protein
MLTVDSFLEITMQKCVFDVKLMDGPRFRGDNGKNHMDCGWLDDRTEGFAIINTGLLSETTNHPSSFIARERAVGVELVAKNPLSGDNIDTYRTRNQRPSVIPN